MNIGRSEYTALKRTEAKYEKLLTAFAAAQAFINSHVADPDITSEMSQCYADYQKRANDYVMFCDMER